MAGRATLTMVTSSSTKNIPVHMAATASTRRITPVSRVSSSSSTSLMAGLYPGKVRSAPNRRRRRVGAMDGDIDLAPVGALLGDPTRCRILTTLLDGRALAASVLAG